MPRCEAKRHSLRFTSCSSSSFNTEQTLANMVTPEKGSLTSLKTGRLMRWPNAHQQRVLASDFMRLITCCIGSKPVSKTAFQNVPLSTKNMRQKAEVT